MRSVWTRRAIPILTLPDSCRGVEGLVWEALAVHDAPHVILDLQSVSLLDETAIAALLRLHLWRPGLLALCRLQAQPARKMRVLGLSRYMPVHADVDAARDALGSP